MLREPARDGNFIVYFMPPDNNGYEEEALAYGRFRVPIDRFDPLSWRQEKPNRSVPCLCIIFKERKR